MPIPVAQIAAGVAALVMSPALAAWTQRLVDDERHHWWYPRQVGLARWVTVTVVATVLALLSSRGTPALLWWLLATGGAVLAVVDAQTYRLPARLVGPLAITEAITLVATAAVRDQPHQLLRAGLAALIVAGVWFTVALISPSALGMGDVYLAGVTAAALGWAGWAQVILGQLAVWLLAPLVLVGVAVARPESRGMRMPVPMGPALIGAAVLVCLV